LFGVLVLAAVVVTVAQRGEIEDVLRLLRHVRPAWVLAGCLIQILTYVLAAAVWRVALRAGGQRAPLLSLIVFALAMLFSNQALPSVGVSGGLVVAEALARRGVPRPVAMSALLVGLVTTSIAFLAALAISLLSLHAYHGVTVIVVGAGEAFGLMAGTVVMAVFEFRRLPAAWQSRLSRMPVVGRALASIVEAPTEVLQSGRVVFDATVLQLLEIGLDALTLWVSLLSVGWRVTPSAVLGSYVIASVASRVAFAPLGIGTFEAGAVTMLHVTGVPLEPALAGTLVFRGLTLWLPMLPGVWCARRILRQVVPADH
jgi:glycosyltransferase 2 family protein